MQVQLNPGDRILNKKFKKNILKENSGVVKEVAN